MNKQNRYVESKSKTEAALIEKIKAAAQNRDKAQEAAQQYAQASREAQSAFTHEIGVIDGLISLAKDLGIDLSKHFPPAPTQQGAPPAATGDGGDSSDAPPPNGAEADVAAEPSDNVRPIGGAASGE